MKRIFAFLLFLSMPLMAADITIPTSTTNNQNYNAAIRAVNDGTNAPIVDAVTPNLYSQFTATTTVKASAGYLEEIVINNYTGAGCTFAYAIKVFDNTAASGTLIMQVSTTTTVNAQPIPLKVRFNTGLTVGIDGTCTSAPSLTASYR